MDITYTDEQIAEIISERKVLPDNWRSQLDKDNSLPLIGENGSRFRIITRKNKKYPSDFSVILGVVKPKTDVLFRLRRYNGMPKRPHKNKIEKQKIYGYHIHHATERYQKIGYDEDTFAEETDRYHDFEGALQALYKTVILNYPHS